MKIGVGSQNFHSITGHAGKSRRFIIYVADGTGSVEERERLDLPKEMSLHEFRGIEHPLFELDALITGGCGQGFITRMSAAGVDVIATSETDPLKAVISYLQGRPLPPPAPHNH